jgi:hypothetical protein
MSTLPETVDGLKPLKTLSLGVGLLTTPLESKPKHKTDKTTLMMPSLAPSTALSSSFPIELKASASGIIRFCRSATMRGGSFGFAAESDGVDGLEGDKKGEETEGEDMGDENGDIAEGEGKDGCNTIKEKRQQVLNFRLQMTA